MHMEDLHDIVLGDGNLAGYTDRSSNAQRKDERDGDVWFREDTSGLAEWQTSTVTNVD